MKLKKLVGTLLVGSMMLSLVACGGSKTESTGNTNTESKTEAAQTTEGEISHRIAYVVGNLGDKSFSDSGEAGMKVLREKGWDCKTIEVGDATKTDKWEDLILDVIDEGYHYIVASASYEDIILRLADEYPDNRFVIFDSFKEEDEIPDNVAYIFYAQNEGSYMVGQMAAGMTKSGVVAVNVGMDNPVIADFVTGFVSGIKDYDPDVKVIKASVGS